MNDKLTQEGLTSYVMSEEGLIAMIQDHLIAWAKEEAQANNRSFRWCYDDTRDSFMAELETKV
jgi:hypothetical protein